MTSDLLPKPADVLLVAEHGTRWGRWMSGLADAGVSLAVIIQRSHEPPASFAQRVRERADALASVKRLPATVFFVASRRVDEGIERGRAAMDHVSRSDRRDETGRHRSGTRSRPHRSRRAPAFQTTARPAGRSVQQHSHAARGSSSGRLILSPLQPLVAAKPRRRRKKRTS